MFDLTFWLITACIFLIIALSISVYLNIRMGISLLKVEDSIAECLDILDERYESMSKILEIPIFFDSVEVRKVINDIRVSRNSILVVANNLTSIQDEKDEKRADISL